MYYIFIVYCFFVYVSHVIPQAQENAVAVYTGAQVWRTKLKHNLDIMTIKKLDEDKDISIWKLKHNEVDYLVKPEDKIRVNHVLKGQRLNHSVLIMDVQRRLDAINTAPTKWDERTLRIGHRLSWTEYPSMNIINEYLVFASENFASICKLSTLGYTAENRTIKMIKISNGNPKNKALLLVGGTHGREWVTVSSALFVLHKIVTKYDQMPSYMKSIDWLIIPVLNPDGYVYSHNHDRLWRKNRRQLKNSCIGVDINRNFNVDWDVSGITEKSTECYEVYSGPYPFSEAESIALRNMITSLKRKPSVAIDLHAYGQLILYPWSARSEPTPDHTIMTNTAKGMAEAIFNQTKKEYKAGATYHLIYPAHGAGIDWMYSAGIIGSFAIELRDNGDHGFLLPPKYIQPVGLDVMSAVSYVAKELDTGIVQRTGKREHEWFR